MAQTSLTEIPRALESYPSAAEQTLSSELAMRVQIDPFNAVATAIFVLAIVHTFAAARFAALAHGVQHRHDEAARADGRPCRAERAGRGPALPRRGRGRLRAVGRACCSSPSPRYAGWDAAKHYLNDTVNYTEPLFVVVIMALASTRPVIGFAEARAAARRRARRRARRPPGG